MCIITNSHKTFIGWEKFKWQNKKLSVLSSFQMVCDLDFPRAIYTGFSTASHACGAECLKRATRDRPSESITAWTTETYNMYVLCPDRIQELRAEHSLEMSGQM